MSFRKNIFLIVFAIFGFFSNVLASDSLFVKNITVLGIKRTEKAVILREILFPLHENISAESLAMRVELSKRQLNKTSLFTSVKISNEIISDSLSIIILVNERWYLVPQFQFALADRNFNAWLEEKKLYRTTAGVELPWINFNGKNQSLIFKMIFGWQTNFGLVYKNPYLNKAKTLGLEVGVDYAQGHEVIANTLHNKAIFYKYQPNVLYKTTKADVVINYRKKYFLTHSVGLGYGQSLIFEPLNTLFPDYLGEYSQELKYFSVLYMLNYDTRDAITYPLTGDLFNIALNIKQGINHTQFQLPSINLKFHHFQPLGKGFNYASGILANISTNNNMPYAFQNALGYDDYVRGYEHYIMNGESWMLLRNELRKNILNHLFKFDFINIPQLNQIPLQIYLKAFLDAGYVNNTNALPDNSLQNQWLKGYGAGIDIVSYYDKSFRVEWSMNGLGQRGIFLHFDEAF